MTASMVARRGQIGLRFPSRAVVRCVVAVVVVVAVAACGGARSRSSSVDRTGHRAIDASGYPATFVAVSHVARATGITVYSSVTGRPLRRLTDGDRDIDPMLTVDNRWVYFVRVPANLCPVGLWRVPFDGGAATQLSAAGYPGGPVALSPDGRMLAYISGPPGRCQLQQSPTWLVLVDLATGQTHRIPGEVWGVAWSPDDDTLAVVSPRSTGPGALRLLHDPFAARSLDATPPVPCPTRLPCAENTPSFDGVGNLFYTATISPRATDICWLAPCAPWSYAVVSVHGSDTRRLTSDVVNAHAVLTSSAIDTAGTAALYTLPQTNGDLRVWRWGAGGPAPIPGPGATAAQPVWR
jgi:hypothetical protein